MKQTTVEWLAEQLEQHHIKIDIKNTVVFQQAKAMEKEQIIKSIIDTIVGSNKIYDKEYPEVRYTAEQYYNETYGN
jgi:hypothetical protein